MIRSPDNQKLKTIRKLAQKRWRGELGLFAAEGEDLVEAAAAAGREPVILLRAGEDVEPALLDAASALGSGTRVIGVYEQRWVEPSGRLCVYLHGVGDPGNVGTIIRSAHALADGPVILGPGCADPYSPKAVRASMGSIFARPPARAAAARDLPGRLLALDAGASTTLADAAARLAAAPATTAVAATKPPPLRDRPTPAGGGGSTPPVTLCLGSERQGLADDVLEAVWTIASIPRRADGPDSLNVATAAAIGLYEVANRMADHG